MIPDMQKCVKHSMIIVILFLCEVKNYSCGRLKKALWNQETRRCRRFRCPYMALAPQFNGPLSNSLFTDGPITTALLINGPISNGPSDQRPRMSRTAFRPTALCPRLFVRGPLSDGPLSSGPLSGHRHDDLSRFLSFLVRYTEVF